MKLLNHWLGIVAVICSLGAGSAMAEGKTVSDEGDSLKRCEKHREEWRKEKQQALENLHKQLALNPTQENAWSQWVVLFEPKDKEWKDHEGWSNLSAIEKLEKKLLKTQEHEKKIQAQVDATKSFYALLSADQKKTFDANFHFGKGSKWGKEGKK
jgi:hypothetical protein